LFAQLRRARADIATMNTLLPAAERIAAADGLDRPGAEHLLLAALELPDGVAAEALSTVGVDRDRLHEAIRGQHAAALRGIGVDHDEAVLDTHFPPPAAATGAYRSQGSLQDAFRRATALAKESHSPIGSGQVLIAVLEPEHGSVARAFTMLGVDRESLASRVLTDLAG
jgi:ATP-dependent Clp protease ATP-binding subunit ClpA